MAAAAVLGLVRRLESGSGFAARASLARTSLLLARHASSLKEDALGAEGTADCDDRLEATAWGPARRLKPPVAVAGAPMRWDRAAAAIGSDAPRWAARSV
jgi:hypothetical protein